MPINIDKTIKNVFSTPLAESFLYLQNSEGVKYSLNDVFLNTLVSKVFVGTSFPSTGLICNEIFYKTDTKELFKWSLDKWVKINWQYQITITPDFVGGRLRINSTTGALEISHDGSTWNECIPLVGAQTYRIMTFDNTNYTQKYFLMPGNSVILNGLNHVPIAYARDVFPMYDIQYYWTYAYDNWLGLRPNNTAISDGDGQHLAAGGTSIGAFRSVPLTIIPFWQASATSTNWGFGRLAITSSKWFFNGLNQGSGGVTVSVCTCSGTPASGSWWMGTWRDQDGAQFTADHVFIRRVR